MQLNFIALALDATQTQPFIPGQVWGIIRNPFFLRGISKQKIDSWVEASAHSFAKSHPELTSPEAKRAGITLSIGDTPLSFMEWVDTPSARLISLANGWSLIDDLYD